MTTKKWGCPILHLKGHYTADFSSNPNQTHLNQLIKAIRITRNFQGSGAGWNQTPQDIGPPGADLDTLAIKVSVICFLPRAHMAHFYQTLMVFSILFKA